MNKSIIVISSLCLYFAAQASLACDYPARVKIPVGATATKEEMINGQRGVKKFVAEMDIYLECIVDEEKLARLAMEDLEPEIEQQREEMLTKKYNAGVEEMEKVAAQFNTEVQAYKGRDDG